MKNLKMLLNILILISLLFSCKKEITNVNSSNLHKLPTSLREVSGMAYTDSVLWVIQDDGNSNEIHKLSLKGELLKSIRLKSVKNHDWEAITSDEEGNLYVGDFGNNNNNRKDLAIYKILKSDLNKDEIELIPTITFFYEDQEKFPPKKDELFYDCESFLYKNGFFYLFTKNRSKDFDGTTHIYKLENKLGNQKAILRNKYITCDKYTSCSITDAAISPDKSKVVLLSNKRMWIFTDFAEDNFTKGTMKEIQFKTYTQREGVTFKDENTLLITDERTKRVGGNLYEYKLE